MLDFCFGLRSFLKFLMSSSVKLLQPKNRAVKISQVAKGIFYNSMLFLDKDPMV